MNQQEIFDLALANQTKARRVLKESGIAEIWKDNGCRVNLIGSLRKEHFPVDIEKARSWQKTCRRSHKPQERMIQR